VRVDVLLAVTPCLVKTRPAEPRRKTPAEEQREAEEAWAALERFPIPRRRRLLELSPRAARTSALAERVRQASVDAAARNAAEARDLAELARFTAETVRLTAS